MFLLQSCVCRRDTLECNFTLKHMGNSTFSFLLQIYKKNEWNISLVHNLSNKFCNVFNSRRKRDERPFEFHRIKTFQNFLYTFYMICHFQMFKNCYQLNVSLSQIPYEINHIIISKVLPFFKIEIVVTKYKNILMEQK